MTVQHSSRPGRIAPLIASIASVFALTTGAAIAAVTVSTPSDNSAPAVSGTLSPTLMDEIVVTANRMDDSAARLGSAYTKIDHDELVRDQFVDVKRAVDLAPTATVVENGGRGGVTEISVRGDRPDHTLVLVDGVKTNSAIFNNASPFLTYASALNLQDVEVVRGPQSMLFGSDALGGVLSLQTRRGEGTPSTTLFFEAGSYQTFREGLLSAGSIGKLDYSLHFAREDTANDRPNNDLAENSGSLRLDYRATDTVTFGISMRTQAGTYEEPGSIRPVDYYNNLLKEDVSGASTMLSAYVDWKTTDSWTQKLVLGWYEESYKQIIPGPPANPVTCFPNYTGTLTDPGFPAGYVAGAPASDSVYLAHSANFNLDYKHTLQLADCNRLIAGVDSLIQTGHDNSFPNQTNSSVGFYAEDEWEAIHNLVFTAGLRLQHHDIWGDVLTYRFTEAYLFDATHTKLHASYGTGFKSPSFFWLYSTSPFAEGNKNLQPERSESWDCGVEQFLLGDRLTLGATYFQSEIKDLVDLAQIDPSTWQYVNRNQSYIQGVEVSANAKVTDEWQTRASFAWIEAKESQPSGNARPYYRPRYTIGAETSYTFFKKLTVGTGVQCVVSRVGSDFATGIEQSVPVEDYTVARIFGRYAVSDHFAITARVENVFGEKYVTRIGFPALGTGAYGGVEVTF